MADTVRRERRTSTRLLALTMEGMDRARLRPGRTADIVNLSSGGALIETDFRLLPGLRVEMQVGDPVPLFRVAARILRCHVVKVDGARIRYRGAVMFDKQLPFGEQKTPGVRPGT